MDATRQPSAVVFFGERWDAPDTEGAQQVPTPVGRRCGMCPEHIAEADRGYMLGYAGVGKDGEPEYSVRPVHRECMIAGTLSHHAEACHCFVDDLSVRERGRRALEWLEQRAS